MNELNPTSKHKDVLKDAAPKISLLSLAIVIAVAIRMFYTGDQLQVVVVNGTTMSTTYSIKVVGDDVEELFGEASAARKQVLADLDEVATSMSTYIPGNELDAIVKGEIGKPLKISAKLAKVLGAAQAMSAKTGGAFDATVGPLVNLWGFHEKKPRTSLPGDDEIAAARARVGYRYLSVDTQASTVEKDIAGLDINLSAIAKGYAVDVVSEGLEKAGFTRYMVEVGGEVRARGVNPNGLPWQIGVEEPSDGEQRKIAAIAPLDNMAMATSGDYRSFYLLNGERYSHTIDPATGHPVTHGLASVTVIARDCMTADAAATALTVLGYPRGMALADKNGWAAYFIVRDENGALHSYANRRFEALVKKRN